MKFVGNGLHDSVFYKVMLFALDFLFFCFSMFVVRAFRFDIMSSDFILDINFYYILGITAGVMVFLGGYDFYLHQHSRKQLFFQHFLFFTLGVVVTVLFNFLFAIDRSGFYGRGVAIGTFALFTLFSCFYRFLWLSCFQQLVGKIKWIVLAPKEELGLFQKDLVRRDILGIFEFIDSAKISMLDFGAKLVGPEVSILVSNRGQSLDSALLSRLINEKLKGRVVLDFSTFYERQWVKVPVLLLMPDWFLNTSGFDEINRARALKLKRFVDVFGATLLGVLVAPLMLIVAFVLLLEGSGGILYSQVRTGKNGKPFKIYKFRSMKSDAEKNGPQWASKNDSRITKFGAFMRKTRIDELPQIWNVLRGEMSFVGPRPERPEFDAILEKDIPFYSLRYLMVPGLTGWAQVSYSYGASVDDSREKLQYDLYYAKHYSLVLDAHILIKTISVVFLGRGR